MRSLVALLAGAVLLAGSGWALAQSTGQSTSQDARAEGEALAESVRDATSDSILSSGSSAQVPGFGGTTFTESTYVDDPDGLTAAGEARRHDDSYRTIIDPYRPQFDPLTIDLGAADMVADDPDAFLGTGLGLGGVSGQCEPLPGGPGSPLTYLESCNEGSVPYDETRSCRAPLQIETQGANYWEYQCYTEPGQGYFGTICYAIEMDPAGGSCTILDSVHVGDTCLQWYDNGNGNVWCSEPGDPIYRQTVSCPSELTTVAGGIERNTITIASETVDETQCQAAIDGADCTLQSEICTAPNETRVIVGLSVTRACWEWERTYQCTGRLPANDCGPLDARPECSFSHEECLSYEPDAATCNVADRWYSCTAPGGTSGPSDFICDGDLYCIDGECTSVTRQASTEFKDAMVAVQTLGELRDDFDPDNLTLFAGENLKCSKKLFGLSNCCSGKGVPLLTPLLCSAEDRLVDQKDDEGLCHNVGTYCSSKVFGICTAKKQSYCCFSSKLTRILQEQGRAQLGKPWGKPKSPDCDGFAVAEFQQLNLAAMDFSEVYAEFTAAARLPDEIEASLMIQQRIADYYHLHAGNP